MYFNKIIKELSNHCYYLSLGAHFITSSTLRIISAASLADIKACSFTLKHSVIPSSYISPTLPLYMLSPALSFPSFISAFKIWTNYWESYPALSAIAVGNARKALANAFIASAYFPFTYPAFLSIAFAILTSVCPPP